MDFQLNYLGSAHSDGDMTLYVVQDRCCFRRYHIPKGACLLSVMQIPNAGWRPCRRLETGDLVALVPRPRPAARNPVGGRRDREYLAICAG